jgi:hypothetical protein
VYSFFEDVATRIASRLACCRRDDGGIVMATYDEVGSNIARRWHFGDSAEDNDSGVLLVPEP